MSTDIEQSENQIQHDQPSNRRIVIFDTTLRDGEQSPGASMNLPEKLELAQALAALGVDVIEAGFPIVSPGDHQSVQEISKIVKGASVCGLARCRNEDIDAAWDALQYAEKPRIHVFLATSAIHRQYKLRMTQDEIIELAVRGVRRARNVCDDIEFSPEDASRTEIDFLCKVVEAVINEGATTVNIPDTVGYTTPQEMFDRIRTLKNRVPNIDKAIISIHCHNDLGMAVANSLAAVSAGAGQIECTINGLGERAGNCSLEEVVMAMRTRSDIYGVDTDIISQRLVPTSRLVAQITGLKVPRNKAIVGQNAFAHESGIHQDGMLKSRSTYEIMCPESVGFSKSDLVLGKHSGRAALDDRAKTLGYNLTPEQITLVFTEFKKLADRKKEIYDDDIVAIIDQQIHDGRTVNDVPKWKYVSYSIQCSGIRLDGEKMLIDGMEASNNSNHVGEPEKNLCQDIVLTLSRGDKTVSITEKSEKGPIDGLFQTIRKIVDLPIFLKEYKVESVTVGQDAQGDVSVLIAHEGDVYRGHGLSTDILEATVLAVLSAVNRIKN